MKRQERIKEFKDHRTSWKFFERIFNNFNGLIKPSPSGLQIRVLLEILKELQFSNDLKFRETRKLK